MASEKIQIKRGRIKELWLEEEYTVIEIAEIVGVSRQTVYAVGKEFELKPHKKNKSKKKRNRKTANSRKYTKLSDSEVLKIKELIIEGGLSYAEIAKLFNSTRPTIDGIAQGHLRGNIGHPTPIKARKVSSLKNEAWECLNEIKELKLNTKKTNYYVSDMGRIKAVKSNGGEWLIKQYKNKKGYMTAMLNDGNGKSRKFRVHRLVAIAFIPNPNGKSEVNHIKGIKDDNRVSQLEWVTTKENKKHAIETGLAKGTNENTIKTALQIKKLLYLGMKPTDISDVLKVDADKVYRIRAKRTFKDIELVDYKGGVLS